MGTATTMDSRYDYSLTGANAELSVEKGLADAVWYQTPVQRTEMRKLLERRDGPGIRDCILWFGLMALFGTLGVMFWGTWWAVPAFMVYGAIYASTSDSRWHESSHGTVFKTDWLNNALYEVASFMVMRESTRWRWSHTRHHSDTIIVGRDPEIAVMRPVRIFRFLLKFIGIFTIINYVKQVSKHCLGKLYPDEASFIPESEWPKLFFKARIVALIYLAVIGSCFYFGTILPLMFIGLPQIYGSWLMPIYTATQHAGLEENVLDHRVNCRTVLMNPVNRFLYWNMNYHIEHHMYPLVPYYNLPKLHELVKYDSPPPYGGLGEAWREIIDAVRKQAKDPAFFVKRTVPASVEQSEESEPHITINCEAAPDAEGWLEVGKADLLVPEDVLRFDHGEQTFAVYRAADGKYYASHGICTHGKTHLATGLVKGCQIECPKHNGRFDVRDGSVQRKPPKNCLKTYPVKVDGDVLYIQVKEEEG